MYKDTKLTTAMSVKVSVPNATCPKILHPGMTKICNRQSHKRET